MSESGRIALVLGATGGIGGETALALSRRGWKIRAFSRAAKPADSSGWEWVKGDALERASLEAAARGVSAIVHAVNPPGYRNWATLVLPMIENPLAAAQASGARKGGGRNATRLGLPGRVRSGRDRVQDQRPYR